MRYANEARDSIATYAYKLYYPCANSKKYEKRRGKRQRIKMEENSAAAVAATNFPFRIHFFYVEIRASNRIINSKKKNPFHYDEAQSYMRLH